MGIQRYAPPRKISANLSNLLYILITFSKVNGVENNYIDHQL